MNQKKILDWLSFPLSAQNCSGGYKFPLHKLTGVGITLGVSVILGSNIALASPQTERSNPYITVFNDSTRGPIRTSNGTIAGTLESATKYGWDFSAIAQAFQEMSLTESLNRQNTSEPNSILYTVFIPTNEAWATLDPAVGANAETLERVLRYHIVPGSVTQSHLDSGEIETLDGGKIAIEANSSNDRIKLNQDIEVTSSIRVQNGVIVFVDKPLIPFQ